MPRTSQVIKDTEPISDPPKTKDELRKEALTGILQIAQFGCVAFGQFADAGAIGMHAQPIVNETLKLGESNSKIQEKIDLLIEVGPYAGLIGVLIPFAAQILVNHKIFKPEQFANAGIVSPQMLEAQMKTELARQAMDAIIKQKQAEEDLQRMQDEIMASVNGQSDPNA